MIYSQTQQEPIATTSTHENPDETGYQLPFEDTYYEYGNPNTSINMAEVQRPLTSTPQQNTVNIAIPTPQNVAMTENEAAANYQPQPSTSNTQNVEMAENEAAANYQPQPSTSNTQPAIQDSDDEDDGEEAAVEKFCVCCGQSAKGLFFGSIMCLSCQGICKRSVNKESRIMTKCKCNFGKCKALGQKCRYCKIEKLREIGMLTKYAHRYDKGLRHGSNQRK